MLTALASSNSTASSSSAAISSVVAVRMMKSKKRRTALLPRDGGKALRLSDRQRDILDSLAVYGDWARPMDIGARDGSHHSATLGQLAKYGLAERKKLHAIYCYNGSTCRQKLVDNHWVVSAGHPPSTKCCCKGSCRYKITRAGRDAVGRSVQ